MFLEGISKNLSVTTCRFFSINGQTNSRPAGAIFHNIPQIRTYNVFGGGHLLSKSGLPQGENLNKPVFISSNWMGAQFIDGCL